MGKDLLDVIFTHHHHPVRRRPFALVWPHGPNLTPLVAAVIIYKRPFVVHIVYHRDPIINADEAPYQLFVVLPFSINWMIIIPSNPSHGWRWWWGRNDKWSAGQSNNWTAEHLATTAIESERGQAGQAEQNELVGWYLGFLGSPIFN